MPTYSQIKVKFNQDLPINGSIQISGTRTPPGALLNYNHIWKTVRQAAFEVTTGTATAMPGERSAINYMAAFGLDFNGTDEYLITRIGNEVTIKALDHRVQFTVADAFADLFGTPADVTFTISNFTGVAYDFVSIGYSQNSDNPCQFIDLNVETTNLSVEILQPVQITGNTDNPITIPDLLRGQVVILKLRDALANELTQVIQIPSILSAANFTISVSGSPNGATVVISNANTVGLDLEYSLDGSVWQTSPTFGNIAPDNYTLHVRDQYGCSFQETFAVSQFGINLPYFLISKSNSIRFVNRITFGTAANYKTAENTFGTEENVGVAHCGMQLFQTADVITTQFKSNYSTITVNVIKPDLSEVQIPIIQKTNNIGITDKRDARIYSLTGGKTGIYFTAGNVYDYNTNAIIGAHSLVGNVPEWVIAGNYIVLNNVWFLIEDVIFDELKNADVAVISNVYAGIDAPVIAASQYNIFNYEVYEFTIDMVNFIDQVIQIRINNDDPNFGSLIHLSEKLKIRVRHENTLEVLYWNNDNTDIFYSTGIKNLIRLPLTKKEGADDEDSEVHKTDTTAILLNAELHEADKFLFEPLTTEIWRKAKLALAHKNVFLDGVQYVKNGNYDTDGPVDDSNLYVLKATMLKTGSVYNSDGDSSGFSTGNIAIPGLIQTESGFVKY